MSKRDSYWWSLVFVCAFMSSADIKAFDLQIHGFSDLAGSVSGTDFPLNSIGNQGNRLTLDPESNLGLNLSADLANNLTFFTQLVGRGNDMGQYKVGVDWLFLTYRPTEALALRAGRQINPLFLYAEQVDVGFTYLWSRLPYEVYGLFPLDSFTGLSAIYTVFLEDYRLRMELFGGAGDVTVGLGSSTIKGHSNNLKGVETSFSSDHFKVHAAYIASNPAAVIESAAPLSALPTGVINGTFQVTQLFFCKIFG